MQVRKFYHIAALSMLMLWTALSVYAQVPPRPEPPRLVNDLANVIPDQQEAFLERELVAFNDTTSTQIVVLTVPSLNGYDAAGFATEVGLEWGVGQKGKNNGLIVLIKPKTGARDRGQAFISTGYGLEGAVPDAIANRIVDNEMIPYFKKNDYFGGIKAGTDILRSLTAGEFTAEQYREQTEGDPLFALIVFLFVVFFVIIMMVRGRRSRAAYSIGRDSAGTMPWWLLLMGSGSSFGGGSSSGSGWSDFSSGGGTFGGFGGGSFGGGGAGGSW